MTRVPETYDDWLALTASEKHHIHRTVWDTYARDGIAFAYTAASRLAISSGRRVLNVEIGTFHGGEYLLHMTVCEEVFKDCPPMLSDEFEGFRVVWIPAAIIPAVAGPGNSIIGSWVSEDGYYEFKFEQNDAGLGVTGNIGGTASEFLIDHPTLNDRFLVFSAYDPLRGITTRHIFKLVSPDHATDDLTISCNFRRADQTILQQATTA